MSYVLAYIAISSLVTIFITAPMCGIGSRS